MVEPGASVEEAGLWRLAAPFALEGYQQKKVAVFRVFYSSKAKSAILLCSTTCSYYNELLLLIYLSIYLSVCLSIYLSIYIYI